MNALIKRIEAIEKYHQPRPEGGYICIVTAAGSVHVSGRGQRFRFNDREEFNTWCLQQQIDGMQVLIVDENRNPGLMPEQL